MAPPGAEEPIFVCRKGYHAINVQAVCDANMRYINAVIRWPGSTHDAFILANSTLPGIFESTNNGWLLGDSGYPLKKWLITPLLNVNTEQERRFNEAHMATRCVIERSFALLKARFR
ncbi:putative nuclease HARBI1 [Ruditapes philippinarum]|uniref:putative nuclease HARBI1 n=1 Tax=Ruditapes philippinarum TaxID=129788 RepID=UPI00295AB5FB|nr:putative nuclease HARBI1 [Ruditapes philippinarum]